MEINLSEKIERNEGSTWTEGDGQRIYKYKNTQVSIKDRKKDRRGWPTRVSENTNIKSQNTITETLNIRPCYKKKTLSFEISVTVSP